MIETIRTLRRLIDEGYTWAQAEEILWQQAEDRRDDERDRQMLEHFETIERARELENFDGRD